mgnify:FL=1
MSDINLNLTLAIFIGFGSTLIQSLTGFGLSIVSTPLFLMVYDPKQVVLILQVICVVINIFFAIALRKNVDYRFLLILFIGSLLGQPLGLLIFQIAPNNILKIFVSLIILFFLIIMQLNHKKITETTLKTGITGVLSGILTTATSMGGPPLILYLANANRDKVSMRATCIAYFAITNISAIIIFLMGNTDFTFAIEQSIYLLPFCFIGLWIGNKLFPYLSQKMFNRIIFVMLLFSSLYTLYSAF